MEPNLHEYPYTQYEDGCSMGCFMGMCRRAGVKLAVVGDSLQLLDKNNFVLSQVKIAIAQSALKDELGNDITAYIINAGTREDTVVFTKGNGDEIVITVPYATEASKDSEGQDITSYLRNIVVSGDKLRVTKGDGSAFEITVPYATKAFTDVNDKPITTYAASMEVSGNNVILKDGLGTVISTITVHFAERAAADENGNNIRESYASTLQAGTTTVKLIAKSGDLLSEITVPYATSALKDTNGNEFLKDYAESLVVDNDGKRLDLLAHDGTLLSAVTVPFSILATDATNAIERAEIVGDQLVLTTYGGVVTRLTIPYAIRALNDGASNEITKTYVHNVVQDPITGEITFYDAEGTALCSLIPNARVAEYDTYNNLIADYIKTLVFDNQSDYLVATHGDGTADTIVVNYATKAWKDTQGNIIKNTYIAFLANVVDNEGEWVLVAYNGEGSELFRLKVVANKAQKDQLGNVIDTFYMHNISFTNYTMNLLDAHGNIIGTVALPAVAVSAELDQNDPYIWYLQDQNGNDLSSLSTPKDGVAIDYEQGDVAHEFYQKLKDADGNTLDTKHLYFWVNGNNELEFGDLTDGDVKLATIGLPAGGADNAIQSIQSDNIYTVKLGSSYGTYYHTDSTNNSTLVVLPKVNNIVDSTTKKLKARIIRSTSEPSLSIVQKFYVSTGETVSSGEVKPLTYGNQVSIDNQLNLVNLNQSRIGDLVFTPLVCIPTSGIHGFIYAHNTPTYWTLENDANANIVDVPNNNGRVVLLCGPKTVTNTDVLVARKNVLNIDSIIDVQLYNDEESQYMIYGAKTFSVTASGTGMYFVKGIVNATHCYISTLDHSGNVIGTSSRINITNESMIVKTVNADANTSEVFKVEFHNDNAPFSPVDIRDKARITVYWRAANGTMVDIS